MKKFVASPGQPRKNKRSAQVAADRTADTTVDHDVAIRFPIDFA